MTKNDENDKNDETDEKWRKMTKNDKNAEKWRKITEKCGKGRKMSKMSINYENDEESLFWQLRAQKRSARDFWLRH